MAKPSKCGRVQCADTLNTVLLDADGKRPQGTTRYMTLLISGIKAAKFLFILGKMHSLHSTQETWQQNIQNYNGFFTNTSFTHQLTEKTTLNKGSLSASEQ